jgi:hypothetical protein
LLNFKKSLISQTINFFINQIPFKNHHFEKLPKGAPHEPMSRPNNGMASPNLSTSLTPLDVFLVSTEIH